MAEKQTTPECTITLPSRGVLYGGLVPDGKVIIRKLLVPEIAMLEAQGQGGVDRISAVIRDCCRLPLPGITHQNLLLTDRMAILLALRTFTYGPVYHYQFKCQFCGQVGKGTTNIAEDLEEHSAPDDLVEPFDIALPDVKRTLSVRFLRGEDEDRISKYAKRVKMQSNDVRDPSLYHRLALQITNIDGEASELRHREDFVKTLTASDLARFTNAVDAKEPGLDTRVYPDCRNCGAVNELGMPFTAEFFRPTNI